MAVFDPPTVVETVAVNPVTPPIAADEQESTVLDAVKPVPLSTITTAVTAPLVTVMFAVG
jgi:hypothetical protein